MAEVVPVEPVLPDDAPLPKLDRGPSTEVELIEVTGRAEDSTPKSRPDRGREIQQLVESA